MSTIAPDQLPVPTTQQAVVPPAVLWADSIETPVASFHPGHAGVASRRGSRSSMRRLAVAGLATLVVALGGAGLALRSSGAGDERTSGGNQDRNQDRRDREEQTDLGDQPDTNSTNSTSSTNPTDGTAGTAGNVSIDYAGTYAAMLGVTPSAATVECVAAAATEVEADVAAIVAGTATTYESVVAGMTPFAGCAPGEDFAAAILTDIQAVSSGSSLDQGCVLEVLDTFTATDRLDVMVTAYVDLTQYAQRLTETFTGCTY